ncbi:MAG: hypothetical protein ACYDH1_04870 [Anaerolineaceae bacterium]
MIKRLFRGLMRYPPPSAVFQNLASFSFSYGILRIIFWEFLIDLNGVFRKTQVGHWNGKRFPYHSKSE